MPPARARCADACAATTTMAARIAAPENVPEPSSVASPCLLPLPHRALPESELLFPLFDISCLLLWVLWGCGRRARVVQAQRQIHRALGKAGVIKPSTPRARPLRHSLRRRCEFGARLWLIVNRYVTIFRRQFRHRLGSFGCGIGHSAPVAKPGSTVGVAKTSRRAASRRHPLRRRWSVRSCPSG